MVVGVAKGIGSQTCQLVGCHGASLGVENMLQQWVPNQASGAAKERRRGVRLLSCVKRKEQAKTGEAK